MKFRYLTFHGPRSYMTTIPGRKNYRYNKFNFITIGPDAYLRITYIIAISVSWKNKKYLYRRYRELQIIF